MSAAAGFLVRDLGFGAMKTIDDGPTGSGEEMIIHDDCKFMDFSAF
jgi:hypothetical protein